MSSVRTWLLRLRGLFRRRRDEEDFSAQLDADLALYVDDRVRAGMTVADARRAAALEFGTADAAREAWREQHGVPVLERLQRDVAFAFRLLRRNRAWATVGILSLALGTGAGAAVFSTRAATLLARLPVPQAGDLVALHWQGQNAALSGISDYGVIDGAFLSGTSWWSDWSGGLGDSDLSLNRPPFEMRGGATMPYQAFTRLRAENRTLGPLFAFAPGPEVNLVVDGHGDTATTQFVSGDFFTGLRIPPAAGRPLVPGDDRAGAERVAVISHAYWVRRFGESPSVVGRQVRINAFAFTIVGVSGAALPDLVRGGGSGPDVALPLATEPAFQPGNSRVRQPANWWLVVMGRLPRGETAAHLEANLAPGFQHAIGDEAAAFLKLLPLDAQTELKGFGFDAARIPRLRVVSAARGPYDRKPVVGMALTMLTVLAGIMLVIVCANLTNLSMALTTQRHRELAVRYAMGATRVRITRQILTEHALMACAGGTLGAAAAVLIQRMMQTFVPAAFDGRVSVFAFALAMVSGVAIGIVPALDASRLAGAPNVGLTARRSRLAAVLLVGQVALSLLLLVVAGLFGRTLVNLQRVDPGFDNRNLVTFTIDPSNNQYDQPRSVALMDTVTARLAAIPGVSGVTFSSRPLMRRAFFGTELFVRNATARKPAATAHGLIVRENFFETIGIRLMKGRTFTARDTVKAPLVAIVSASLARQLFGNADPIGRRVGEDRSKPEKYEVVGVVADAHAVDLRHEQSATVYWPHRQWPDGARSFEVRTTVPPESVMPAIRTAMDGIDSTIPLMGLSTQASAIDELRAPEQTIAVATATLGGFALAVSMIGLFGLASYRVARRTKDIAIRIAIGAGARTVLRAAMRESLVLVGAGVVIGLVISLSTTRLMQTLLFGLAPNDPGVIGAAVLTLSAVALLAGYLPARRAAKVDPMATLRQD